MKHRKKELLAGRSISPKPISGNETVVELVDDAFLAYNARTFEANCFATVSRRRRSSSVIVMTAGVVAAAGPGSGVFRFGSGLYL